MNLQLPSLVTVQLKTCHAMTFEDLPYRGPTLAFTVRTYAREGDDYQLGPFFSDDDALRITASQLEASVRVHLDWGLMDYGPIDECFPFVEIRPLWGAEVRRIAKHRKKHDLTENEALLWGTLGEYLKRLKICGNRNLIEISGVSYDGIRDMWDGSRSTYEYLYRVDRRAAV